MKLFCSVVRRISRFHTDTSVLGWPAWWRVACVVPVLLGLWLVVWWAAVEVAPL